MKLFTIHIAVGFLFLTGCVSAPKGPQQIQLKSPDQKSITAYRASSQSKEYLEDQLIREKSEGVDFLVETSSVDKPSSDSSSVRLILKTLDKNGTVDLHEYGFPEPKESIEFHYRPSGEVLKAGSFQQNSLFFVPPLPLPHQAVEEGDTWEMNHQWLSASGLELKLDVVGIHKGFKNCGKDSPCVDIEISGSVSPANDGIVGMELSSRISGHLLFSLPRGQVHSSKVKSEEELRFPKRKVISKSCMVSAPTQAQQLKDVSFSSCEN